MPYSIAMLCHYAKCHYAECRILFSIVLSIVMLSVVMLNVFMLSFVANFIKPGESSEIQMINFQLSDYFSKAVCIQISSGLSQSLSNSAFVSTFLFQAITASMDGRTEDFETL